MVKKRDKKTSGGLLQNSCKGALLGLLIALILMLVFSLLISKEVIKNESSPIWSGIAVAVGSFLGALTAATGTKKKKLICALISASVLAICLGIMALGIGTETGEGGILMSVCCILMPSIAAGFIKNRKKRKRTA